MHHNKHRKHGQNMISVLLFNVTVLENHCTTFTVLQDLGKPLTVSQDLGNHCTPFTCFIEFTVQPHTEDKKLTNFLKMVLGLSYL